MESSNTALRAKNDAAAARELRELREDTLKGLNYTLDLIQDNLDDGASILAAAIDIIESRWPA